MKKLKSILFLLVLSLALAGCKKEENDVTKPVIQPPANLKITAQAGSKLQFAVTFTDNADLGAYQIEIHDDFDGHGHGKTGASPYYKLLTGTLSGKTQTVNINEDIPSSASSGPYHIVINATDKAGNAAEFVEMELTIDNDSKPVLANVKIDAQTPVAENELVFESGVAQLTRALTAEATDADGLAEVKIVFMEAHAEDAEPIFEIDVDLTTEPVVYNITEALVFEKAKLKHDEHYELKVVAKDKVGNYAVEAFEFHVKIN